MELKYNQAALAALDTNADVERFVGDLGQQVADRANARAETLFTDQGGGGVGSIESHLEHDSKGTLARVAYPPEHFYMWIHEVGSEHERPRPHVRPALFGTKKATGGKESSIKGIRQSKSATAATKRNRAAATGRRTAKNAPAKAAAAERRAAREARTVKRLFGEE
jgi:hypothetical protein